MLNLRLGLQSLINGRLWRKDCFGLRCSLLRFGKRRQDKMSQLLIRLGPDFHKIGLLLSRYYSLQNLQYRRSLKVLTMWWWLAYNFRQKSLFLRYFFKLCQYQYAFWIYSTCLPFVQNWVFLVQCCYFPYGIFQCMYSHFCLNPSLLQTRLPTCIESLHLFKL